ncbi:hypothetical protein HDU82_002554 [Entophlyctis luteolus]|nr:hypothetical protein HDU82_002554 [Entophlyctis luteolus]KAJ3384224.1 hypothetical protein HDU84_003083 [Entophlyctis sp. JEL0112]
MSSNANTPAVLVAEISLYSVGFFLNSCILFASAVFPKRMIRSQVDVITLALIAVNAIWSLGGMVTNAMIGLNIISQSDRANTAFTNISIILIFGFNLNLAMESVDVFHFRQYILMKSVTVLISEQPASNGIQPDNEPQATVWVIVAIFSYALSLVLTAWFYISTYLYSRRQFQAHPRLVTFLMKERGQEVSDDPETVALVRMSLERQVLIKCIALSSSLVVCYLPLLSLLIATTFVSTQTVDPNGYYYGVGLVFVALDVIVTPLLVFNFKKELRDVFIFWK